MGSFRHTKMTRKANKVLILTNKEDISTDFVILELQRKGIPYIRFNTEDFPMKTKCWFSPQEGSLKFESETTNRTFDIDQFYSIYYRRPGTPLIKGIDSKGLQDFCIKECQEYLQAIWDFFDGLWVSYPPSIFAAQNKVHQLSVAEKIGFKIPKTLITNDMKAALSFLGKNSSRVIAKAVRQGAFSHRKKNYVIFSNLVSRKNFHYAKSLKVSPVIFQEYIEKEYEIRVTVIGTKVFAAKIKPRVKSNIDWRTLPDKELEYDIASIPYSLMKLCTNLVNFYGLKFGAIDLAYKDNAFYFFEINPNGQWAWLEQRLGLKLSNSIANLLGTGKA